MSKSKNFSRRHTLIGITSGTASLLMSATPGLTKSLFSKANQNPKHQVTPSQTAGPFYPLNWNGDSDNDLVIVKGEAAKALGQVLHLRGRVLDTLGQPVFGARVEIWQCDAKGIYHHPRDSGLLRKPDIGFQGRGYTITDASGQYSFRTIKPVAYPGRTPHIHFRVASTNKSPLTTQMYIAGDPLNASDFILNAVRDSKARDALIVKLEPADRIEQAALQGVFDIILP